MCCTALLSNIICLAAFTYASPVGSPEDKRNILVPNYIVQTTTVDPSTWSTASWTGTPDFLPTSVVDITDNSLDKRANDNKHVVPIPSDLTTTTTVALPTDMAAGKRAVTSMPDLVPSTTVVLSTDSSATWTGTPDLMPTTLVKLGTTSGCQVSLSTYSTKSGSIAEVSFVTQCSDGATPTADSDAALSTEVSACCGGQYDLYACGDDGSMPTGTVRWRCTFDGYTYAGVSASATTSWA